MLKYNSIFFGILVCFLLCLVLGCSPNKNVSGQITLVDGKPISAGTILFQDSTKQAFGSIDANGRYSLGTLKPNDGILPGSYRVVITNAYKIADGFVSNPDSMETGAVPLIGAEYMEYETTPLFCVIEKSGTNYDFVVEPFKGWPKK
ncbi:MAG: carboxypeptidase-like regulatory domain-containing protein [Thermoguttaceae bacterium]